MSSYVAEMTIGTNTYMVVDADMSYYQHTRGGGLPSSKIKGGTFTLKIESSSGPKYDVLTDWMFAKSSMQKGVLRFYKEDGISRLFDFEFYDAHCINYREHFNSASSVPMTTTMVISPGITKVKELVKEKSWKISQLDDILIEMISTIGLTKPKGSSDDVENEVTPEIVEGLWIDEDENLMDECYYGKKAFIKVKINNSNGGRAKLTIKKSDGTELAKGKKQITFNDKVNDEGIVIASFSILEKWEETKGKDFDYLIFSVKYMDVSRDFDDQKLKMKPHAQQIIEFRRDSKYKDNYNYGFDWMRDDRDSSEDYKVICSDFDKLENEYKPFKIKLVKNKDSDKDKYVNKKYYVQWLSIFPEQEITLTLNIKVFEEAQKLEFYNKKDPANELLKFEPRTPPMLGKGEHSKTDGFKIKCLKEFKDDQEIEIIGDDDKNRVLGKLRIIGNEKKYTANVVVIEVWTNFNGVDKYGDFKSNESTLLENHFVQTLTTLNLESDLLNLQHSVLVTTDELKDKYTEEKGGSRVLVYNPSGEISLHQYLINKYQEVHDDLAMENPFADFYKIFLFNESGGYVDQHGSIGLAGGVASGIPASNKCAIIFDRHNETAFPHELFHCLGIYHPFSSNSKNKFKFSKGKSKNIMDYTPKERIFSWKWQWDIIHRNLPTV